VIIVRNNKHDEDMEKEMQIIFDTRCLCSHNGKNKHTSPKQQLKISLSLMLHLHTIKQNAILKTATDKN
jgi:hypothetical protein